MSWAAIIDIVQVELELHLALSPIRRWPSTVRLRHGISGAAARPAASRRGPGGVMGPAACRNYMTRAERHDRVRKGTPRLIAAFWSPSGTRLRRPAWLLVGRGCLPSPPETSMRLARARGRRLPDRSWSPPHWAGPVPAAAPVSAAAGSPARASVLIRGHRDHQAGGRCTALTGASPAPADGPRSLRKATTTSRVYLPGQIRQAYNLPRACTARGLPAAVRTIIIIVDSFGSPTVQRDLSTFDKGRGVFPPPPVAEDHPARREGRGRISRPPNREGWAGENRPRRRVRPRESPPGASQSWVVEDRRPRENEGTTGFPADRSRPRSTVIDHHLGGVISQSFSATELTFPVQAVAAQPARRLQSTPRARA